MVHQLYRDFYTCLISLVNMVKIMLTLMAHGYIVRDLVLGGWMKAYEHSNEMTDVGSDFS